MTGGPLLGMLGLQALLSLACSLRCFCYVCPLLIGVGWYHEAGLQLVRVTSRVIKLRICFSWGSPPQEEGWIWSGKS